ncbi:hypothetical protein BDV37DRAFT_267264 [Aspergillus pseudonomiae]|uniref:Uncharacterized protein n=1 Tax=Aspergillus pseudonomiae TaxID=1506151 RepID=A0A5N7CRK5_9EURO|nr:uncharacterized protein BDV37DRAFT_267264 [Aspergillus pseudonomiae]KAE8396831.1 hypothetical protein BDV37DRAFT_267264 [Aspergillus pseudonomiae]
MMPAEDLTICLLLCTDSSDTRNERHDGEIGKPRLVPFGTTSNMELPAPDPLSPTDSCSSSSARRCRPYDGKSGLVRFLLAVIYWFYCGESSTGSLSVYIWRVHTTCGRNAGAGYRGCIRTIYYSPRCASDG